MCTGHFSAPSTFYSLILCTFCLKYILSFYFIFCFIPASPDEFLPSFLHPPVLPPQHLDLGMWFLHYSERRHSGLFNSNSVRKEEWKGEGMLCKSVGWRAPSRWGRTPHVCVYGTLPQAPANPCLVMWLGVETSTSVCLTLWVINKNTQSFTEYWLCQNHYISCHSANAPSAPTVTPNWSRMSDVFMPGPWKHVWTHTRTRAHTA